MSFKLIPKLKNMKAVMKRSLKIISLIIFILLTACSATQETAKEEEPAKEQIYVFDDGETDSTVTIAPIETVTADTNNFIREEAIPVQDESEEIGTSAAGFTVQLGAFSTKEKAETFVKENQKDINHKMEIHYSTKVNLFVVWLENFSTKEEAESVRNTIWASEKFKDAFIVPVE